jgi:nucleotide-binding universal stress UspA family protein
MLKTAVVKVSFKETPGRLAEMVSALRSFGTQEVHLVHVRTSGAGRTFPEKKRAQLERIRQKAQDLGLAAEVHILDGHPPTRVLQAVWQLGADYIAIAWVHKAVLRQALLGSIDGDIVRMSDSPVFIFKHRVLGRTEALDSVLYATDFQATDARVMPYLKNREFQARALHMLHVGERAPDPTTDRKRREVILANLSRLASECAHAYERIDTLETVGPVGRNIVRTAKTTGVDLVIVGKVDNPDNMLKKLTGSVADQLPHRAPCSVFIIPGYRQNGRTESQDGREAA